MRSPWNCWKRWSNRSRHAMSTESDYLFTTPNHGQSHHHRFEHHRILPGISLGRGSQFGHVPLKQADRIYWFGTQNLPHGSGRSPATCKHDLLATFRQWHKPIPELIEATSKNIIVRTEIYDRPPLRRWSHGRVTLLGDAAHPMTPDLGQGACQALEDAAVLTPLL
jgi:2-polyprenyl-6-methoxyphenol hydroxylase-like FAD-dependent oxidoreductase